MAIRNPYALVDWAGEQIPSFHHEHGTDKVAFDLWVGAGVKHIPPSNYSNSPLGYPLDGLISMTPADVPSDVVGSPNGEHFGFTNTAGGHVAAIGSTLTGDPVTGYGGRWQDFIDDAEAALLYPGTGGFCINHPGLNYCGDAIALQMLDYSEAVLGLEIWNSLGDWYYSSRGWGTQNWHNMLVTGRRCFGLGSPDHWTEFGGEGAAATTSGGVPTTVPPFRGFNRLLVPSGYSALSVADRELACLQAYRDGRFYVALEDSSPELVNVTADATSMTVEFASSCNISFLWARHSDVAAQTTSGGTGTSATYTLRGDEVYVRAVGSLSTYEQSLTQPVMFIDQADIPESNDRKKRLLLTGSDEDCCGGH